MERQGEFSDKPVILVVGGAGYVGSHACKALHHAGFLPVTLDNLSRGHRELVQWGPIEVADICDRAAVDRILAGHKPRAVMHFAALSETGESVRVPDQYYLNNVAGTRTLLQAMIESRTRNFVFSSSCAIYGQAQTIPITETTPCQPVSPYARTKLVVEWMLQDFAAAYGLRFVSLRYFNAAGADPEGETGEWHDPETHLIPRVLMAANGALPHIELYGTDYPTPDGTCVRDYVHVTDLGQAHLAALQHLLDGGDSNAVNLGTGTGYSVREIISAISRITGRRVSVLERPRREGDPATLVADVKRARELLAFIPRHSDLDTIITTAQAWLSRPRATTAPRAARALEATARK